MTSASDGAQPAQSSSTVENVSRRIADEARSIADEARSFAEDRKTQGAMRIGGVAQAIHSAADQVQRELPQAAGYIHDAAARLETASSMVRERSLEDLMCMVDDFARRQPAAFFGGSVVAGFLLSRFLKSSNARRPASSSDFGRSHR